MRLLKESHKAKSSLCSKLGPKDQGERAKEAALCSLAQLDLGYIDLYLIHWPGTQNLSVSDQRNSGKGLGLGEPLFEHLHLIFMICLLLKLSSRFPECVS